MVNGDRRNFEGESSDMEKGAEKSELADLTSSFSERIRKEIENNERAKELLAQLDSEVQRLREKTRFSYGNYEKYITNITQPDDNLRKVKERLLEDTELGEIYRELLELYEGDAGESFQNELDEKYLKDLIYESMNEDEKEIQEVLDLYDGKFIKKGKKLIDKERAKESFVRRKRNELFIRKLQSTTRIDLALNQEVGGLTEEDLRELFQYLQEAKGISFDGDGLFDMEQERNRLGVLTEGQLRAIFENFQNARYFSLAYSRLRKLRKEQLEEIFPNLQNTRDISLRGNNLGELGPEELESVFSNLQNARIVDLANNNLGKADKEQLEVIFSNLQNAGNVVLSYNDLAELGPEELDAIFSNLQSVTHVDLENIDLAKFSKEQLEVIFRNLQNLKSVNLSGNNVRRLGDEKIRVILKALGKNYSVERNTTVANLLGESLFG